MPKKQSLDQLYLNFQLQFSADAEADDYAEIRRHIEYLGLDGSPAAMLEGTNFLLLAIMTYCKMDNRTCKPLIKQQRYWLCGEDLPFYCLTFIFNDGHFGRVLTDEKISFVDFADLYDHPWEKYKTVGFDRVYISRLDGDILFEDELETLTRRISEDIYFDFAEDEVAINVIFTNLQDDTVLAMVWDQS